MKRAIDSTYFRFIIKPKSFASKAIGIAAILTLSACKTTDSGHNTLTTAPTVTPDKPTQTRTPRIQQLLEEAYYAFIDSRLTTPVEDNAYFRYLQVLAIDPLNDDANRGISNIVEQYLEWSLESLQNRNFRAATNYLNKARSLDETHPNILAVETRISEYRTSKEENYLLDPQGLKQQSISTRSELISIARRIQETAATAVISARNDSEGRWIYQQLNGETPGRVKARFQQRSKPGIRLIIP